MRRLAPALPEGPVRLREKGVGVQGGHLNPLGLFLRASIPYIWSILSAFDPPG